MNEEALRRLLEDFAAGRVSLDEVMDEVKFLPYSDLGFAKVDHHREVRSGLAESVFAPGKTEEQVAQIAAELSVRSTGAVLVTRATAPQFEAVKRVVPEARFHELSGLIVVKEAPEAIDGVVVVAAAGTADQRAAEEAAVTAEVMGAKVERLTDVGVAGLHRLLAARPAIDRADVIICVAGMEGALASLIGGLASAPVIAVPTSVNYGAGEGGIATLLAMLNSCAPGVVVTNIDNGYGAAVAAIKILKSR